MENKKCVTLSHVLFKTMGTPTEGRRGSPGRDLSGGGSRSRKRKRLRDNLALLASEGEVNYPQTKRQSHEFASNSCSASFLDTTADASAASNGGEQHHAVLSVRL